ncbi:MAG: lipopolysaccharide heptosyltransferase II [Planctomycetes bacterium]|nr:lipopolysaccharide heptosyltransferase II [Planctomycetota bacterium]
MKQLDLAGKRVLLIKPSSLGDVCHAAASAWAIKQQFPTCHLTWLVNKTFEPLIKPLSCLDGTLGFERTKFRGVTGMLTGRSELRSFVSQLRAGRFDVAIDLQGLLRSGMFSWLSRAKVRVGMRGSREGSRLFYNRRVEVPRQPVHARDRYRAVTRFLGCETEPREDLDVRETERAAARDLLAANGFAADSPLVAVCPGARWETKIYPPQKFAAALDELAKSGVVTPVIIGSPDMDKPCAEVAAACKKARPVNLCGKTSLRELAALLDISRLLLTCDSGPMHIAAAQGTPVVAVLGPTDARRTGPYGQLQNVVTGDCELMPCLKRECPGLGIKCMRELDAEDVAERALQVLQSKTSGRRAKI